jgi:hypothetical protein
VCIRRLCRIKPALDKPRVFQCQAKQHHIADSRSACHPTGRCSVHRIRFEFIANASHGSSVHDCYRRDLKPRLHQVYDFYTANVSVTRESRPYRSTRRIAAADTSTSIHGTKNRRQAETQGMYDRTRTFNSLTDMRRHVEIDSRHTHVDSRHAMQIV